MSESVAQQREHLLDEQRKTIAELQTPSKVLAVRKAGAAHPLADAFLQVLRGQIPA